MASTTTFMRGLNMIWLGLLLAPAVFAVDTYLAIHNLTPYALKNIAGGLKIGAGNLAWPLFPPLIGPGTVTEVHISYQTVDNFDASSTYQVGDGSAGSIQIVMSGTSLYLVLDGLKLPSQRLTNTIKLGFETEGGQRTPLFLGGGQKGSALTTQYIAPDWMQRNLQTLGCQPLRHLILPGSHDAGMSEFNAHTLLAGAYDVETQTMNILEQLKAGIRFFDIRPAISGGHYVTGHYDNVPVVGFQGGNGQSMADIIKNLNTFLDNYGELVILTFSNSLNTDNGYSHFTPSEWAAFSTYMSSNLKHLFVDTTVGDLSTQPLSYFIGKGQAAVILINSDNGNPPVDGSGGWYGSKHFPMAGSYANTISRDDMRTDQIAKLNANRPTANSLFFQLSWTLTTGANTNGIISWAQGIYTDLFAQGKLGIFGMTSAATYPNLIWIDAVPTNQWLAMLCLTMSQYYSSCAA